MKILGTAFAMLLLSCCFTNLSAQMVTTEYLLSGPRILVDDYKVQSDYQEVYYVGFDFGSDTVQNPAIFKKLFAMDFLRIDYVYTKYRESSLYDQDSLNINRFEKLKKGLPHVFDRSNIEWNIVAIKEANEASKNQNFFHGFVLYGRPYLVLTDSGIEVSATKIDSKSELKVFESAMKKTNPMKEQEVTYFKKKKKCTPTGFYLPKSRRKELAGIRYTSKSVWNRRAERNCEEVVIEKMTTIRVPDVDSMYKIEMVPVNTYFPDTIINTVFNRKINDWKDKILVMDVTGSMSPYTYQTMNWLKMNMQKTQMKKYVFFNDGDSRPDGPVGNSGGAYQVSSTNIMEIETKCAQTMRRGNGGQGPENNIEALLFAQRAAPDARGAIMIADNWAPVRDLKLIENLNIPVHIILCGVLNGNINVHYLDIAFATGGSVHTIEQDIENLNSLMEGDIVEVGKQKFRLTRGRFELTR